MANLFLDSSALVKKYARETGSRWVLDLFRPSACNTIYIARVTPAETVAGLARQNRIGTLSAKDLDRSIRRLTRAMSRRFIFIEITRDIIENAIKMIPIHGLRGYDAVQLSAALSLSSSLTANNLLPLTFICADNLLNTAARAEGLPVDNPNNYP